MNPTERVSFSPGEFAALFGKSQTWGYRQIYAQKVKTITEYGRIQIPAAEVERILASAGLYNGLPPPKPRSKVEIQKLKPKLADVWQKYVANRRDGSKTMRAPKEAVASSKVHSEAIRRLTRAKSKENSR